MISIQRVRNILANQKKMFFPAGIMRLSDSAFYSLGPDTNIACVALPKTGQPGMTCSVLLPDGVRHIKAVSVAVDDGDASGGIVLSTQFTISRVDAGQYSFLAIDSDGEENFPITAQGDGNTRVFPVPGNLFDGIGTITKDTLLTLILERFPGDETTSGPGALNVLGIYFSFK